MSNNIPIAKKLTALVFIGLVFLAGVQAGQKGLSLSTGTSLKSVQKDLPADLDYSTVEQVYDELKGSYDGDLDVNDLMIGLKQGLVAASGDPYTEYMSPDVAKDFQQQLDGSFEGIGAQLGKNDNGNVIVVSPIDGFPAKSAGLQSNDIILAVDDKDASKWTVDEAVDNIRGPKGTEVKLRVLRGLEDKTITITRATIDIPSVEHEVKEGDIGYIKITQFGEDTSSLVRKAAVDLSGKGVEGVVLDLRGNPGGYLDSAVDVSSNWLSEGDLVLEEKRAGKVISSHKSTRNGALKGVPTVVLVNEGSASASEIVAGALRDNGVAQLVGVKTFGKGSVQRPTELPGGGLLKVTVARWFTPKGVNIDKEGLSPDKEVEITADDIKTNVDPQLSAAVKHLKQ